MDHTLQLHEFFVEGKNPQVSHVLLNITEPSTPEEKEKGYFFAICEISQGNTQYISRLQEIIDQIENDYYELPNEGDKSSLEIVLDKINQQSFILVKPGIELNCAVGAMRGSEIIFSFCGQPQMLLLYHLRSGQYKKMDLVKENFVAESETERKPLFSQIVQGKLSQNDFLFVGTQRVVDYFNHDRLHKIITSRTPRQSAEHLQRVLGELRNDFSFGGIIIHLLALPDGQKTPIIHFAKKNGSAKSLSNFFKTEKNTSNILSSSLMPRMQQGLSLILNKNQVQKPDEEQLMEIPTTTAAEISSHHLRARDTRRPSRETKSVVWKNILQKFGSIIWRLFLILTRTIVLFGQLLIAATLAIGRSFVSLFFLATNRKNKRREILNRWLTRWRLIKNDIKMMPLITKLLFIVSFCAVIGLLIGLIYLNAQRKNEQLALNFKKSLALIKEKKDAAEAALIYDDIKTASSDIDAAKKLISEIDCAQPDKMNYCKQTLSQLDGLQMKIRKMYLLTTELLTDWSDALAGKSIQKISLIGKKFISISSDSGSLFSFDLLTKEKSMLANNLSLSGFSAMTAPKENDILVTQFSESLAQYNFKEGIWKKIDCEYPNADPLISDILIYNRRLYTLDARNNQIYKHDSTKTGYSRGKPWVLDANISLKDGIGLAIDGDLFVLSNNGAVDKFTAGKKQIFALSEIDPALSSANEIYTYTDINNLYLLDSSQKRIVVFDKTGKLIKQLTAKEFVRPDSFVVDEASGVIYVLDSNKLYKINIK